MRCDMRCDAIDLQCKCKYNHTTPGSLTGTHVHTHTQHVLLTVNRHGSHTHHDHITAANIHSSVDTLFFRRLRPPGLGLGLGLGFGPSSLGISISPPREVNPSLPHPPSFYPYGNNRRKEEDSEKKEEVRRSKKKKKLGFG